MAARTGGRWTLIRKLADDIGIDRAHEVDGRVFRRAAITQNRDDDAHESGVTAAVANGVSDKPEPGGKLSGNDTVVALIPIEDDALLVAMSDHIFVDDDRSIPAGDVDRNFRVLYRLPSCARKAVLRGVGGLPVTLRAKECDHERRADSR